MIGSLFAGTDESPGEVILYQGRVVQGVPRHGLDRRHAQGHRAIATSRTSSSSRRDGDGSDKLVPEGIEGRVPHKGTLATMIHQLVGGLRAGHGLLRLPDRSAACRARRA